MRIHTLVEKVMGYANTQGRTHLPWRKTRNPYRILVSEIMLQQTQVNRVIPKYKTFIKEFPTIQGLADAPLSKVLWLWQGLGYNRRGKLLHDAAKILMQEYKEKIPQDLKLLQALPGVGKYTAGAVCAFAFDIEGICIETNIRTVFLHHFFAGIENVSDLQLEPLIQKSVAGAKRQGISPKDWYAALMDYGAYLKRSGISLNRKSAHYTKQSSFKGSRRELRGKILHELLIAPSTGTKLSKKLSKPKNVINTALHSLQGEGMITVKKDLVSVI